MEREQNRSLEKGDFHIRHETTELEQGQSFHYFEHPDKVGFSWEISQNGTLHQIIFRQIREQGGRPPSIHLDKVIKKENRSVFKKPSLVEVVDLATLAMEIQSQNPITEKLRTTAYRLVQKRLEKKQASFAKDEAYLKSLLKQLEEQPLP